MSFVHKSIRMAAYSLGFHMDKAMAEAPCWSMPPSSADHVMEMGTWFSSVDTSMVILEVAMNAGFDAASYGRYPRRKGSGFVCAMRSAVDMPGFARTNDSTMRHPTNMPRRSGESCGMAPALVKGPS